MSRSDVRAAFPYQPPLPMGSMGARASGFWGVVFLVLSEASIFAYLFFSYFYFSVQPHSGPWPPSGPPDLTWAVLQTAAALIGCATMWWADRAARRPAAGGTAIGLGISLLLSLAFIVFQILDWHAKPFALATDPYSSLYFTIGGIHLAHAVVGAVMIATVLLWSLLGYFGPARHVPITVAAAYWYFVAIVWLGVFFTLYVSPYLG
jgi:heme/copper-type cytochrome/quinol oxidase subunit 3